MLLCSFVDLTDIFIVVDKTDLHPHYHYFKVQGGDRGSFSFHGASFRNTFELLS